MQHDFPQLQLQYDICMLDCVIINHQPLQTKKPAGKEKQRDLFSMGLILDLTIWLEAGEGESYDLQLTANTVAASADVT